jgi:MFS family permease
MVPFTVGALGCAMLMGLGNGAVFKLVPEQFPKDTGTVTGLVGAFGGLGGFFPPLLLGVFHDRLGVIWPGFLLLSATALVLRGVNQRVFRPGDVAWTQSLPVAARQALERVRAGAWAALVTATLAAAIVVGSRDLQHFDAALVGYTFATLFAAFGSAIATRCGCSVRRRACTGARVAGLLLTARAGPQRRQSSTPRRWWSSPRTPTSSGAAGSAGSRTG